MPLEVLQVPLRAHPLGRRPGAVRIAGGRTDVVDAAGPGGEVRRVVLRAEGLEAEALTHQGGRRDEIGGDEDVGVHAPTVANDPSRHHGAPGPTSCPCPSWRDALA